MSNTDFSISAPTFVQFDYNGWPDHDKDQLEISARALTGVTAVNQAGARSSIHVHYNPGVINRDDLILSVNRLADPILGRLKGSSSDLQAISDTEITREANVNQLQAKSITTAPPEIGLPVLKVHDALQSHTSSSPEVTARGPIRSSAWTGRKSLPEQIAAIRAYAPLAIAGLDALATAIEDKRYNDEATLDALRILKELRAAIDDLINAAETGRPLFAHWEMVERRTNDLIAIAKTGAKVIVGAPIVGLGAAFAISLLTGDHVTGQMVATMAGGSLMAGAIGKIDKKP